MVRGRTVRSTQQEQTKINKRNLIIAVIALVISIPGAVNQAVQYVKDVKSDKNTAVTYYSPTPLTYGQHVELESCTTSSASDRHDAARCFSKDSYVYDPCFSIEDLQPSAFIKTYNCPSSLKNTNNVYGGVQISKLDIPKLDANTKAFDYQKSRPWIVVLKDGTECRMFTGTITIAYGDVPNMYGCSGDKIEGLTPGKFEGDKYVLNCKEKFSSTYKRCVAKTIYY